MIDQVDSWTGLTLLPPATALNVNVSLDGAERATCILDALIKALHVRGHETTIRPPRGDQAWNEVGLIVRLARRSAAMVFAINRCGPARTS